MRPSLRFSDKTDWKNYFIYELCDILTGYPFEGNTIKSKGKNALMRGINITEGYIRHSRDIDRFFDGDTKLLSKYRLKINDLVIGMDGSKVGKNSALVTDKETGALLVQRVARLRSNDIDTIKLLLQLFESKRFFKYVDNIKTSSAIPHISLADIKQFVVALPTEEHEKNSLSSFCELVRRHTALSQEQLYKLQKIKSACLHSMFPQEGELVPKVRFKGFYKKWNTISFSQAFDFLKNNSLSRAELAETGTVYNIHYGDILIKFGDCLFIEQNSDIPFIKDERVANKLIISSLIKNGDIIFADAAEDYTVGKCIEIITKKENKIVSGLHTIACRPTQHFASGYLGYFLNSNLFHNQLIGMIQGSKVCGISKKGLQTTHLIYPEDLGEQQKIAAYFENLDRQISLQTQRLEKLKHIKSACLDKMFV